MQIRPPRHRDEIMVEHRQLATHNVERRYSKRSKLEHFLRHGWAVWVPAGTGWTRLRVNREIYRQGIHT